jgi:hypothetical protein
MDVTAPYDWNGLFARCARWGQARAEWERGKGNELTADWLPAAFAPATEAQIAREEARLGVRLPPSLRSFYLHSNGHGVVGNAIWAVRKVEELGWLRDVEPELYDIVFEDDPAVGRSLVASHAADASWWLLDPGDVDARGEWRMGRWSSWSPGMEWIARDFFGLFENEVAMAETVLQIQQSPPPLRPRNELSIGDIDSRTVVDGTRLGRNGYRYVRAEGFASVVTVAVPASARVGEWIPLRANRRSGPWNPVREEEVRPGEIGLFEPLIFERGIAGNLSWSVDPPGFAMFDTARIPGADPDARYVMFREPGTYRLKGYSCFPLGVFSNEVTIRVV